MMAPLCVDAVFSASSASSSSSSSSSSSASSASSSSLLLVLVLLVLVLLVLLSSSSSLSLSLSPSLSLSLCARPSACVPVAVSLRGNQGTLLVSMTSSERGTEHEVVVITPSMLQIASASADGGAYRVGLQLQETYAVFSYDSPVTVHAISEVCVRVCLFLLCDWGRGACGCACLADLFEGTSSTNCIHALPAPASFAPVSPGRVFFFFFFCCVCS